MVWTLNTTCSALGVPEIETNIRAITLGVCISVSSESSSCMLGKVAKKKLHVH